MHSPLRIALVGPCPADLCPGAGGIDSVVALLAWGLAQRGERVEVLSCDFDADADRLLEVEGVRLHRFGARKRRDRSIFHVRERRWIRRRLAELSPDIVHALGTDFHAEAALRHPAPSVLTVDGEPEKKEARTGNGLASSLRDWASEWFEARALARARAIVVPNLHVLAGLEQRTRAPLYEIPLPVDPAFFSLPDGAVPGRLLYVGAIQPRKGLLDLVRALPTVVNERPDVRLHVVGESSDLAYATEVKSEIERARLDRFVVWRGALDERGLLDAFASCSILVLPSADEASPLVVAQAMAAGKPVVAHAVGGVPSLVADGASGLLVTKGYPTGMADALLALIEDEERRRAIGAHAAALARESFDPGVVVEWMAALYRQLLSPAVDRSQAFSPAPSPAEELLAPLPTGRE